LKYAGVAFLIFVSIQTLLTLRHEYGDIGGNAKVGAAPTFRLGLLTNLTNVKAAVFAVNFIPQFISKDFSLGVGIFVLACIQATVSTTWYLLHRGKWFAF
jgi:threonine/homoserine/homoserine lactone efflux protein